MIAAVDFFFEFVYTSLQTGLYKTKKRKVFSMEEVGAYEAKTHLPALLRKVKEGKCFQITVRGVPVAHLVPVWEKSREQTKQAVARMKRLCRKLRS